MHTLHTLNPIIKIDILVMHTYSMDPESPETVYCGHCGHKNSVNMYTFYASKVNPGEFVDRFDCEQCKESSCIVLKC